MADTFTLGGHEFTSRFILGSGKYSLDLIKAAVEYAGAQIVTLALRRATLGSIDNILDYIPEGVTLLPNTSGARNAEEAVRIARLAREVGCGNFIKIECIHESKYLLPDNYETIKATEILAKEGFVVLPYMYPDLNAARDLVNAGAAAVMPLGAPIGTNKGLVTKEFIQASASRVRHVRQWKWAVPLSCPTPPLQRLVIFRQWLVHSSRPLRQAVPLICPAWAAFWKRHLLLPR